MDKTSKRGGSRTLDRTLSNNTSGLNGIWFRWMEGQGVDPEIYLYVCSAWKDKRGIQRRTAYSINANGKEGALIHAISARKKAGLPVPTLAEAMAALDEFMKKGPS